MLHWADVFHAYKFSALCGGQHRSASRCHTRRGHAVTERQPDPRAVAMEKAQWEKPVDGGAISERGRLEAAKNQVVVLKELMRVRGCKEEFVPNPALLEQGQVSSALLFPRLSCCPAVLQVTAGDFICLTQPSVGYGESRPAA